MTRYVTTNTASQIIGRDSRSILKRLAPDGIIENAQGEPMSRLFLRSTVDANAERIRGEAVRGFGGHMGRSFGVSSDEPSVHSGGQTETAPDTDTPVADIGSEGRAATVLGEGEILYRLLGKYADKDGRVAADVPALIAKAMGADVAQRAAMALLNSGRLTVDMTTGTWTVAA